MCGIQAQRLDRVHAKVRQRRNDYLHKLSSDLVVKHDLLCLEDLNISALAKTKLRGHAKSWLDGAFGSFKRMLEYKTAWNFKRAVFVDRYFASTKRCHVCHVCSPLTLSDRAWQCSHCQTEHDRDHNAEVNIAAEGLRLHGATMLLSDGRSAVMPVERASDFRKEAVLVEAGTLRVIEEATGFSQWRSHFHKLLPGYVLNIWR